MNCQRLEESKFLLPQIPIRATTQHLAVFLLPGSESSLPAPTEAAIYLQFLGDASGQWRLLGALKADKPSAIFKISLPTALMSSTETLLISLGISLQSPSTGADLQLSRPTPTTPAASNSTYALLVAKKLLDSFVNYALSFAQSVNGESFVPGRIISEWYAGTVRRAQVDPEGFLKQLMKTTEASE